MLKYILIPLLFISCSVDKKREFNYPYEEIIAKAYTTYLRQSSRILDRLFKDNEEYLSKIPLTTLIKQTRNEYTYRLNNDNDSLLEITACKEVVISLLKRRFGFFTVSDHLESDIYSYCYYGDDNSIISIINFVEAL